MEKYIGIHVNSNIDDLINHIEIYNKKKFRVIQFFVDTHNHTIDKYNIISSLLIKHNIKCIIHGSYTINLANEWNDYSWWIQECINEIHYSANLNAYAYVIHIGKQLKMKKEDCYNNMYTSLLYIHDKTKSTHIKILLETSSGQGSELCYKIEDLAYFFRKFSKNNNKIIRDRFRICLDTCHILAAGYNIKSKNNISIYFDKFNELIGLENIYVVHLNDSKNPVNSHIDRHENIGDGYIGKKSLEMIAKIFILQNVPIILETPDINIENDFDILLNIKI